MSVDRINQEPIDVMKGILSNRPKDYYLASPGFMSASK
jgi:hypothetical protein